MAISHHVHLDCDTGIDDALALAHLLSRPSVDLVAISTVSGNTTASQAARNTLDLFALAARDDIPVAVGAPGAIVGGYRGGAPHVHGNNGIGEVSLPPAARNVEPISGPEQIIRSARHHAGDLHLVAVGPLTNLAEALHLEPELPKLIKRLTIMGGAVWVPGNITEYAEANIANDPEAALAVFGTEWPITLVPLDVTLQHSIGLDEQHELAGRGTAFHTALAEMLDVYLDFYEQFFGERRCALHDPLASMIAVGDAIPATVRRTALGVDPSGFASRGRTSPTEHGRQIDVVTAVSTDVAPLLMQQILALDPSGEVPA